MAKLSKGTRVQVTGERKIRDGEVVAVFEDYGLPAINVRRDNGEIHVVERANVKVVRP